MIKTGWFSPLIYRTTQSVRNFLPARGMNAGNRAKVEGVIFEVDFK